MIPQERRGMPPTTAEPSSDGTFSLSPFVIAVIVPLGIIVVFWVIVITRALRGALLAHRRFEEGIANQAETLQFYALALSNLKDKVHHQFAQADKVFVTRSDLHEMMQAHRIEVTGILTQMSRDLRRQYDLQQLATARTNTEVVTAKYSPLGTLMLGRGRSNSDPLKVIVDSGVKHPALVRGGLQGAANLLVAPPKSPAAQGEAASKGNTSPGVKSDSLPEEKQE